MRNSSRFLVLAALAVLAAAGDASAANYELYSYGWYWQLTNGLNSIALQMSSPGYGGAMFAVAAMGTVAAVWYDYTSGTQMRMCIRMVAGWIITAGLFLPADLGNNTIIVYDPTLNEASAPIPVSTGIAVIAVMINTVDRGLTESIELGGDPVLGPIQNPSGQSAAVINQLLAGGITITENQVLASNLGAYIHGCFVWASTAAGNPAGIDLSTVYNGNTDLVATLGLAALAGIAVETWYTAGDMSGGMSGLGMPSCQVAWAEIQPQLMASPSWANSVANACARGGYDKNNPAAMNNCNASMTGFLNQALTGNTGTQAGAIDPNGFARQAYLSEKLTAAILAGDPSLGSNLNYAASTKSEYAMAAQWTPANMGAVYAYLFAALPLLMLFLPTALWLVILPFICGTFMYVMIWHLIDMGLALAVRDTTNLLLLQVQSAKLGIDDWSFLRDVLSQTLLTYEHARVEERIFAGVIAGLFGLGGGAMLEGAVRGLASSQARYASQGGETTTPTGESEAYDKMVAAGVSRGVRYDASKDPQNSYRKQVQAGVFKKGAEIDGASKTINQVGGGNVSTAIAVTGNTIMKDNVLKTAERGNQTVDGLKNMGALQGREAEKTAAEKISIIGGGNINKAADITSKSNAESTKMTAAETEAKAAEFTKTYGDSAAGASKVQTVTTGGQIGVEKENARQAANHNLAPAQMAEVTAGKETASKIGVSDGYVNNDKAHDISKTRTVLAAGATLGDKRALEQVYGEGNAVAGAEDTAYKGEIQKAAYARNISAGESEVVAAANARRDAGMAAGFVKFGREVLGLGKNGESDAQVAGQVAEHVSELKTQQAAGDYAATSKLVNFMTGAGMAESTGEAFVKMAEFDQAAKKGMLVAAHGDVAKPVASATTAAQDTFGVNRAKRELANDYFGGNVEKASAFTAKYGGVKTMENIHAEQTAFEAEHAAGNFKGDFTAWQKARQSAGLVYAGEHAQESVSVNPQGKVVQRKKASGSASVVDNTNVEKTDGLAGTSENHFVQVGKEKVLVSGSTDNTLKDTRTTDEGVTSTTSNPLTGHVAFEKSEGGKTQVQHMDDKSIVLGTVVQGDLKTHAIKQAAGENAADMAAMGLKGVDEVVSLGTSIVKGGKLPADLKKLLPTKGPLPNPNTDYPGHS